MGVVPKLSRGRLVCLVFVGLLVGFILPITVHGDLLIAAFNSSLILTDDPNFYHALADEPTAVFPTGLSGGPYGPLYYYPMAAWLWIADVLSFVDVSAWTGPNDSSFKSFSTLLVLKVPNLVVYGLVGLVLARLQTDESGPDASLLWLANPAVILFTLMMGQNDAWTVLSLAVAVVLGLRALSGHELSVFGYRLPLRSLALIALAVGGAIKLSPVLLIVPFALILGRTMWERIFLTGLGLLSFYLLIAPFLGSEYFREYGLFGQQAGQVPDVPLAVTPVLYAICLAVVFAVWRRKGSTAPVLLFALLAVHVLLFALPGWNPQRSVLFIGMLVLAVAITGRREFLAAYMCLTLFGLLLALEHQNEIAIGMFEPLTRKVLAIPPLFASGRNDVLFVLLYAVSGIAWVVGLARFIQGNAKISSMGRLWPWPIVLVSVLVIFIFGSALRLSDGLRATPYTDRIAPLEMLAGEELTLTFFTGLDELRGLSLDLDTPFGTQAKVRLTSAEGQELNEADVALRIGENRFNLGRFEDSSGQGFVLRLLPGGPVSVEMARLPADFAVAAASIDGNELEGVPYYSLHHKTTWPGLLRSAWFELGDAWRAMATSVALSLAAVLLIRPGSWGRPPGLRSGRT